VGSSGSYLVTSCPSSVQTRSASNGFIGVCRRAAYPDVYCKINRIFRDKPDHPETRHSGTGREIAGYGALSVDNLEEDMYSQQ
jgi:hypothetical protein